ncbi:MAG: hypothetical protein HYR56_04315 [Acidobacteria bacterium]|nr:hypothetical protein [Acidobacteriota bacterium]MBI3421742.1 hypothetical protein [Acidobacteriota bacterium]
MKRSLILLLLLSATLSVSRLTTLAQTPAPQTPPKVLQLFREEVKPYMNAAHENVEAGWPKAFAKAKSKAYWLGMTSMSGPSEAWFLNSYDSFAALEANQQEDNPALQAESERLGQQDKNLINSARGILASLNEGLSYRPAINLAQMRYFWVETFRIRPGHYAEFVEYRRILNAAHEKANIDEHWAVYDVDAGLPADTVLIFHPLRSLKDVDQASSLHGQAYVDALGAENRKKIPELQAAYTLSSESNYFAISPKMSYVPPAIVAGDPAFWHPKPKALAKAPITTKKAAEKTTGAQ